MKEVLSCPTAVTAGGGPVSVEVMSVRMAFSDRDWEEDFAHENGNYCCSCCECNQPFIGHKRRVICRKCSCRCKNCCKITPDVAADICPQCVAELAAATVRCSKCGKVPGEWPRRKYCGDGSDKDNGHNYQLIQKESVK